MCPKKNKKAAPVAAAVPGAQGLENQVGLGVDIVEIARMAAVLKRTPRFKSRVFTADEQAYCDSMASPEIHYATRFAAKEAVLKALGTGFGWGTCDPRNVEVRRNVKGRPFVVLHGAVKEIARQQKITEIPISLSYTHAEAVACAMAITDDSVAPAAPEDPMIELSRQFKELRNMLDDIDDVAAADAELGEDGAKDAPGEDAAEDGAEGTMLGGAVKIARSRVWNGEAAGAVPGECAAEVPAEGAVEDGAEAAASYAQEGGE